MEKSLDDVVKDMSDVIVKIEKLEAKFELFENMRKTLEEKISHLSEEIGQLRTGAIEQEKFYHDVEVSSRKMEAIAESLRSEEVIKDLQRAKVDNEQLKARIDRLEEILRKYSDEMSKVRQFAENIRPLDETLKLADKVDEKLKQMTEQKKYIETSIGKAEKIYVDVRDGLKEIDSVKKQAQKTEEITKEAMKTLSPQMKAGEDLVNIKDDISYHKKELVQLKQDQPVGPVLMTVSEVLNDSSKLIGKLVSIDDCKIRPISQENDGFWHEINDGTGAMAAFTSEELTGEGRVDGVIQKRGNDIYIKF